MEVKNKTVILGAGLAGLSAAYHLREGYEIFEKEGECGGLCRSRSVKGFTFDIAGHLLHFKDKKNLVEVTKLLEGRISEHVRNSWVWTHGLFIPYPFQSNFSGLPAHAAQECLEGFQHAQKSQSRQQSTNGLNFKEWIMQVFGEGIAKHFMVPYNEKFWKFPLERMDHPWARQWIPAPSLDPKKETGYNVRFWYPCPGGIQVLADSFVRRIKKVHTRCEAVKLDLKEKEVHFSNGLKVKFKTVITTIPLPELARIAVPMPERVKKEFLKLKYVSLYNVNLGLSKNPEREKHWIYFPQPDISFYRLGVASNFSGYLAPAGASSLYFEISYSKDQPFDRDHVLKRIMADCRKAGLVFEKEDISVLDLNDVRYAYCLYDDERASALKTIQDYLKKHGIFSIGRYGGWKYASMEDVMIEAQATAQALLKR